MTRIERSDLPTYPVIYTESPSMVVSYDCMGSSCRSNSVEHDGDTFVCNDCGTSWEYEGDDGQLYEEWSGEKREAEDGYVGPLDPDDWSQRVAIPCDHRWSASAQPGREFCGKCANWRDKP